MLSKPKTDVNHKLFRVRHIPTLTELDSSNEVKTETTFNVSKVRGSIKNAIIDVMSRSLINQC